MALPRYDAKRSRTVPVLDHRTSASPWAPAASPGVEHYEDERTGAELSDAERARTIMGNNKSGTLSIAVGEPVAPLGFVLNYSITDTGDPVISVRRGVEQVANLRTSMPASFSVADTPLTATQSAVAGGVTVVGNLRQIDDAERATYLSSHSRNQPGDVGAVQRGVAKLFVLQPEAVLVSGHRTDVVRVAVAEYASANADPLAAIAPGLASHLSGEQNGSLVLLCRAFGDVPGANSARFVGIDRYGMDLLVETAHGRETVRLSFTQPVSSSDEVRRELSVMVRGARFKLGVG